MERIQQRDEVIRQLEEDVDVKEIQAIIEDAVSRSSDQMREEREQQLLEKQPQLDDLVRFADATFDTFDETVPGVRHAYQTAFRYAMRPRGWLVLVGPNGCGKTHLAVAVAKERQEANDTMMIQTVPDLLDHLRSSFSSSTYERLFDQLRTVEFLVLDDLGAHVNSPWAQEKLFQLLNYRYNRMLPTLIIANHVSVDERIASRLSDRGLVTMVVMDQAKDYRPHNVLEQEKED
ncbi:ATP-binding protein [Dictyobacter arantiisoli]|uniref:ATP-binding protein n=1 Tax=Dictyobacter arantiisoli TaxID=2014874 RepID=A0A5A5TIW6_9CHLR|nr:ATP-binding protein [Dictyobacter arantiisoli]GCF10884.1 ATP-binding protein [Dictyobacter arantiisoli]